VTRQINRHVQPFLEPLGLVALNATRIEFLLGYVRVLLIGGKIVFKETRGTVRDIRRGLIDAGIEGADAAAVVAWSEQARDLLAKRGNLMHSLWNATSDILPDDARRMGIEPLPPPRVHSTRLRAEDDEGAVSRDVEEVWQLASDLDDHASALVDVYPILRRFIIGRSIEADDPTP